MMTLALEKLRVGVDREVPREMPLGLTSHGDRPRKKILSQEWTTSPTALFSARAGLGRLRAGLQARAIFRVLLAAAIDEEPEHAQRSIGHADHQIDAGVECGRQIALVALILRTGGLDGVL